MIAFIKKYRPMIIFFGLVLLVIGLSLTSIYFYKKYNRLSVQTSGAPNAKEVADLVRHIGRIVVLPEGETPTVATVTDPTQLADQDFFAEAKTGDKVIIYAVAKKAILYDPEKRKIINMAPVNVGNQSSRGTEQE